MLSSNLNSISFIAALNVPHWLGQPNSGRWKKPTLLRRVSEQRQCLGQMARSSALASTAHCSRGMSLQPVMVKSCVSSFGPDERGG